MTKKTVFLIGALVILAGGIWLVSTSGESGSSRAQEEIKFSIDQPEKINRIFFTNKSGKYIDLTKNKDSSWLVNNSYTAWQKKVDILLETFKKVRVKGTAPKPARDNVIAAMSVTGIKVEVYTGSEIAEQVFYIGGTTPDQLGTYFWKEGAETPYVTYIPGFEGYLNSRFDLQEINWISPTIFAYNLNDIKQVAVNYSSDNFSIARNGQNWQMTDASGNPFAADSAIMVSYLRNFRKLNMESVLKLVENKRDSILSSTPFASIAVQDNNGGKKVLRLYQKPAYDKMHNLYTEDGERLTYDPNRYYANVEGKPEIMIVQDYTFAKVLRTSNDFIRKQ